MIHASSSALVPQGSATRRAHPSRRGPVAPQPRARPRADLFQVRLALDGATRDDAFALRYRSYFASGFIEMNAERRFADNYDDLATTRTIVAYQDGVPVGSVRACMISRPHGLAAPATETFPDEVAALIGAHPSSRARVDAIEVNRLVRSPEAADNQGLVFLLYRLAGFLALHHDARMALSCVRQNHVAFYRRLGFVEAAAPRPYPGLNCRMHLMACPREEYDASRRAFPVMDPARFDDAFDGFLDGRTLNMPFRPF